MADKQYVYAVARIRSKELSLLSGAFLEQLTAAKDYDECIQLLMEKGWGEDGMTNAADILAIEKRKTWELINELVEDMSAALPYMDTEMRKLADHTLTKLRTMSDAEFAEQTFDFTDDTDGE